MSSFGCPAKRSSAGVCCNGLALLLLCAVSAVASAQALTDPTKPPAEISAPLTQAAAPEGDRLQSIIISPTRRAAIINGQTVELGAKYGEAKLVEVSESGVALQGAQGRQVLTLFPGVEIKRKEQPKENDVKHAIQKKKPVKKPASQTGKKEEK
ncbi:MAG: hypothetical protein HY937_06605 [Nitrosomonadales bacterium]|nr:hypothetical protein [Nitrosomonadales bacterium]